ILNLMFGPYWFGYWFEPIGYIFLSQILWLKTIKRSNVAVLIIAICLLLIRNFSRVIFLVTSLHRDYVPSSWVMTTYMTDWLIMLFVQALIFALTLLVLSFLKNRISRM
ncbi:MAG: hydrogenase, partial [Cytophagales bacterium]